MTTYRAERGEPASWDVAEANRRSHYANPETNYRRPYEVVVIPTLNLVGAAAMAAARVLYRVSSRVSLAVHKRLNN